MPDLAQKVDRLERRLHALEQRLQQQDYRPVRELAKLDNEWPDTYRGFVKMMDREGVPKRTRGGQLKTRVSSQKVTYVSMGDLRKKC